MFEEYGQKTVCIPAAYHCKEILRSRGIPARLSSMNVIAMNQEFLEWRKREDSSPMPPGAWSVGITENNPDGEGYLSHLVCVSKGLILDCAAGQLSRPQHGMPMPDGLIVKPNISYSDGEGTIVYYPSKEPVPPMWRLDPEATARTRARIQKEIL